MVIQTGQRVRSYDFERERQCYIVGIIEGLTFLEGCHRYKIRVERKVWAGKEVNNPRKCFVFPPINGTLKLQQGVCVGVCDGIELVI